MPNVKQYYFTAVVVLIFLPILIKAQNPDVSKLNKTTQTPSIPKEKKTENTLSYSESDNLIHLGDLIEIDVLGSTEFDWRGNLNNEGFLDGVEFTDDEVFGLCRTEDEIAAKIAKSYGKILNNPKIKVTILDRSNRNVARIFGAIKKPQQFVLKREVFLNEIIVVAGGFSEKASGDIQILRRPNASCFRKSIKQANKSGKQASKNSSNSNFLDIKISDILDGKTESNPQIFYGDMIIVRKASPIYVIGGIVAPSKLQFRDGITVSKAIASSGGLTKSADSTKIMIFRRLGGKTEIIKINLEEIEEGKINDVKLKAYDIVDVTEKGRDEKKYPPIIRFDNDELNIFSKLPVTIIN